MRVQLGVEPTSSLATVRGHLLSTSLHGGHLLSSPPHHSSLAYFSVFQPEDCGLFPCSAVHVLGLHPCWDQAAGKRVKSPCSFRCLRPGWRTGRERRNGGFLPLPLEPKLGGSPCSPPYLPLEPSSGFRTPEDAGDRGCWRENRKLSAPAAGTSGPGLCLPATTSLPGSSGLLPQLSSFVATVSGRDRVEEAHSFFPQTELGIHAFKACLQRSSLREGRGLIFISFFPGACIS